MRVAIREQADADLDGIYAWIEKDNRERRSTSSGGYANGLVAWRRPRLPTWGGRVAMKERVNWSSLLI